MMEWRCYQEQLPASRVLVVGAAVKEIRDHLQHRLEKAYFVAWHSTEDAKAVHLHSALPLLLNSEAVLPGKVRLVPVARWLVCDGEVRVLERVCGRGGCCGVD